MQGRPG